ncbi:hypothetical protein CI109_103776 [Kwoniella shandongensis]|uniref:Signal peptidase complex subunit 2 n=1 Tax=Kwoniella shandongensis TaxID=1734106 RepID=A0A5M6CC13_9TREE|nr:uncharacterized protein CI109_000527 [Kwoniella shandongensis]KAA5530955.1 hypothetical protein CI109_000527 [Kwoniella shandongensis]
MAASKRQQQPNGVTIPSLSPVVGTSSGSALSLSTLATDPLPSVIVNNANLGEIKSALDDIVKKHLVDQSFTPSLVHPTVHLGLGYSSVILALSSVLYSLRVEFEESKPVLWVAVIGYSLLQTALWAWKRWVEKGEVFRGKRRRMVKRIETDHVQIISSTTLKPPPPPAVTFSPHTRPSSPTSSPSSPSTISPSTISPATLSPSTSSTQITRQLSSTTSPSSPSSQSASSASLSSGSGPTYLVHLNLSTTSNNGKSLIHKSRVVVGRGVGEFVDEEGGVEEGEVVRWLGGILSEAGLVGAEEEGVKEE